MRAPSTAEYHRAVAYAVQSMPVFWIGLVAIAVFALSLGWLPAGGLTDITAAETRLKDIPGQRYRRLEYGVPAAIFTQPLGDSPA